MVLKSLYIGNRLFQALGICFFAFCLAYAFPSLLDFAKILTLIVCLALFIDLLLLYGFKNAILAHRPLSDRLSNGDQNSLQISITNLYPFKVQAQIIDEVPAQFQMRESRFDLVLQKSESQSFTYFLRPTERGLYSFGHLLVYASSPLGLLEKRFRFEEPKTVAVYPAYLQMRKYELMAFSNRLNELGVKKIRKLGHNMEFDQIRDYVLGDDYRSLNWKASARANRLMVNQYRDEKSQPIYSVIDKGRLMQMPFEKMTLLDYAINASLVISNIAMLKSDKAGLITFNTKIHQLVPASNQTGQMKKILETLYAQETQFAESDMEKLVITVRQKITHRSLILLFSNFETLSSMERQLPYFRSLAQQHVLIVIFFENTEVQDLLHLSPQNTEELYIQTIAEKFVYDKRLIVKELARYGIDSILSSPKNLTVQTLNKYLELKARGVI